MRWAYDSDGLIRIPVKRACNGYYLRWYYNGWHYWFFLPGVHTVETEGEPYRTLSTRKITVSSGQVTRGQAQAIRTVMNTREVYMWAENGWASIRIEPGSIKIYQSEIAGTEMEMTLVIGSREVTLATGFSPVPDTPIVEPTYPWCETVIGNQVWMCLNYDVMFPGSTVYDNNIFNLDDFKRLYSFSQINTPGFCPTGWRVPTIADWQILFTFVGAGEADKLKTAGTTYWSAGNAGTNAFGFQMRSTGRYRLNAGYDYLMERAYLWAIDSQAEDKIVLFNYNSNVISYAIFHPLLYFGVRLIKGVLPNYITVRYGYLYNYPAVVDARNITAAGWHVPDQTELFNLLDYLADDTTAGGKLKETGTIYWDTPNTGATNIVGFNFRGAGIRSEVTGVFSLLNLHANIWTTTSYGIVARTVEFDYNFANVSRFIAPNKHFGASVRPVKDTTTLVHGETGIYQGNDHRVYRTICINGVEYVADNICETLYRDLSPIPEVTGNAAWIALTSGGRCSYNNDESLAHA